MAVSIHTAHSDRSPQHSTAESRLRTLLFPNYSPTLSVCLRRRLVSFPHQASILARMNKQIRSKPGKPGDPYDRPHRARKATRCQQKESIRHDSDAEMASPSITDNKLQNTPPKSRPSNPYQPVCPALKPFPAHHGIANHTIPWTRRTTSFFPTINVPLAKDETRTKHTATARQSKTHRIN
jgi:hypothetical protein